jgi:hypothetical protein
MKLRNVLIVATLWAGSLLCVGLLAQERLTVTQVPPGAVVGRVISGDNIGFAPEEGIKGSNGKVVGRIVVKVNGQWMHIESPVSIVR